jgi:hypothetical protein
VSYTYSFDTGAGFGSFGSDSVVPAPTVPLLTHTSVRVKAIVDFGVGLPEHPDQFFTDPGYAEAVCAEETP